MFKILILLIFQIIFTPTIKGEEACMLWRPPQEPNRNAVIDTVPTYEEFAQWLGVELKNVTPYEKKTRLCRYRDEGLFVDDTWTWRTGAGCYCYINALWLNENRIVMLWYKMEVNGVSYLFPIGQINNKLVLFDYTNIEYSKIIESSFKEHNYFLKWEKCAKEADDCCTFHMNETNIYPTEEYPCPATWDAWSCFPQSKSETISQLPCPDYTSSSNDAPCTLYSQKECFANGTWNQQTRYDTCASAPVYRRRHNFHVTVLYISIALSLPAVIIFISYKSLRILRVNLHRNLLIACIIRNILTILAKELVILDSLQPNDSKEILLNNGILCRVLAYFNSVATNSIYACMLMDGYYLHKLIVRIFNTDPKAYLIYIATAVLSFIPSTIWAILMALGSNDHCWMVVTVWYQWVPDAFRIAILVLNIILLGNIVQVLLRKLKKNVTAQHTKYTYVLVNGKPYSVILLIAYTSTLKALSFLLPLFGVPFILTAVRPNSQSCVAGDVYYYFSYLIQGLQSVMVAIVFCYWNKEVHIQIKGTYNKLIQKYGNQSLANNRRETTATMVGNNENRVSTDDSSRKADEWLADNKPSIELQTIRNSPQNQIFDGVTRFIDESNENIFETNNALK